MLRAALGFGRDAGQLDYDVTKLKSHSSNEKAFGGGD